MMFQHEGKTYDTLQMRVFEAGAQTVYVTADYQAVFVQTVDRWTGIQIERAGEHQIRHLAQQFGIAELLKALPQ